MFGRKKMYKKGLADAMQAYESFGKKQEEALEKIRQEVRDGNKKLEIALAEMGESIYSIFDLLDKKEKEALYHLHTPMDIKDLEDSEKRLLLAILFQLAEDEGDTRYNDYQRKFILSVKKYLEITNPQTEAEYSSIENIDSIDIQKVFMRVILEFLYLQDEDEITDWQEEVFDYFSVNKRYAKIIECDVIRRYHILGAEGLAENYGESRVEVSCISGKDGFCKDFDFSVEIADRINRENYLLLKDYIVFRENTGITCINKRTNEEQFYELDCNWCNQPLNGTGNVVVYRDNWHLFTFNIDSNVYKKVDIDDVEENYYVNSNYILFNTRKTGHWNLYSFEDESIKEVKYNYKEEVLKGSKDSFSFLIISSMARTSHLETEYINSKKNLIADICCLDENYIYFVAKSDEYKISEIGSLLSKEYGYSFVGRYNLSTQDIELIKEKKMKVGYGNFMWICNDTLYFSCDDSTGKILYKVNLKAVPKLSINNINYGSTSMVSMFMDRYLVWANYGYSPTKSNLYIYDIKEEKFIDNKIKVYAETNIVYINIVGDYIYCKNLALGVSKFCRGRLSKPEEWEILWETIV